MDRFKIISDDVVDSFMEIYNKKSFPLTIKFQFINDTKLKKLVKISKIPDDVSFILNKELKISINEDLLNVYDEESINILYEQELDRINYNLRKSVAMSFNTADSTNKLYNPVFSNNYVFTTANVVWV